MLRHPRDSVLIHSNTRTLAITVVATKTQEQIELINTVLPNVCANDKPVYENMLLELYQRLSDEQRQSEADAEAPAKRVRQAGCPKPKRRKTIKIFEDEKEDDDNYKMSGVVSVAPPTSPKGKENEGRTTPKRETT
ncbi:unnamed protein product [Alternaria alternata]|uniref:uncharacterized protein n=1 Tax=Alternaria postmessia TaxID=1187938 RepID=UPI0022245B9C|nr:uncharacterized protein J4E82_009233 [Alternaria postmessia]KAI5372091.1 hypothetical protein J4E82_009233 [Alternaria postmessia]